MARKSGLWGAVLVCATCIAPTVHSTVIVTGAQNFGDPLGLLSASAAFTVSGTQLSILLENTTLADSTQNAQLLTGVYWNIGGSDAVFSTGSVTLANSSTILGNGVVGGNPVDLSAVSDVSGEFSFRDELAFGPAPARQYGVSSSGMDVIFGNNDLFSGVNLDDPVVSDGPNFGMAGRGSVGGALPNSGSPPIIVNPNNALSGGAVLITLTFTGTLAESNISSVGFQYGTSQSEPFILGGECNPFTDPFQCQDPPGPGDPEVPEPASLILRGLGLAGVVLMRRKRTHF